ncbi:Uncharacterised protein [Pluralibacter gergoviae]|nr:Uncharacterised protein [Pluralibacter gergoviae]
MPAQTAVADPPVVGQIALGFVRAGVKARQSGEDLSAEVLLGPARHETGAQGFQRPVVGNAQGGCIVLPAPAENGLQQGAQRDRRQLGQRQRALLLAALQRLLHHRIAQLLRIDQEGEGAPPAAPGLRLPAQPSGLAGLAQQGADVAFAAEAACGQLGDGGLLRRAGGGLPQALELVEAVELAHRAINPEQ